MTTTQKVLRDITGEWSVFEISAQQFEGASYSAIQRVWCKPVRGLGLFRQQDRDQAMARAALA